MGHAKQKSVLGICGQQMPWSACAFVQSDQDLYCMLSKSVDTTECMNREQMPAWYLAHAQGDLNLRILRVLEGTFLLDAALLQ